MNQTHPSIDQIVDHLHSELSAADEAAMHAHLAGCRDCRERRDEEAAITQTLRAHARATELELPLGLAARIRSEAVRTARPSWWQSIQSLLRPAVLAPVAIAAAAAVVIYVRVVSGHGAVSPTPIDASYYVNEHAALTAQAPFGDSVPPATLTSDDEAH